MADRKTYPSIPVKNWWDLRRRAQQSPPPKVDPDYLQSVLGVQEGHAKNLISPLTAAGLIDTAGGLTPLGENWRHDDTYAEACKEILENVYPDALRSAFPPPTPNRAGVEAWFARNAKVGTGAARKMATTYLLVAAGDPEEMQQKAEGGTKRPTAAKRRSASTQAIPRKASDDNRDTASAVETAKHASNGRGPSIHVDVQVHISPDASSEQIDAIFASMAKHLYPER